MVTLKAGNDVAYYTRGQCHGGCVGAVAYYTAGGDPPGQWGGRAAERMGLTGQVDPEVFRRLYQDRVGPGGERLMKRRQGNDEAAVEKFLAENPKASKADIARVAAQAREAGAREREDQAVARYRKAHPFASETEIAEARTKARAKNPDPDRPYYDLNTSAAKSISVLHASLKVSAQEAFKRGDLVTAGKLHAEADGIEADLLASVQAGIRQAEAEGCYTRTGHHSSVSGEWRDGADLIVTYFTHYISRDGDPDLHIHAPVANLVQRADGGDETWRALDGQQLYALRLSVAATISREMTQRMTARSYVMVPREDGNGFEVGGISPEVMTLFSSRRRAITAELAGLTGQYTRTHGEPPSKRTIYLLGKQAENTTRRSKAEARKLAGGQVTGSEPDAGQRMTAWEEQTEREEIQALSQQHPAAAGYARDHRQLRVLDDEGKARAARIAVAEVQQHHTSWSRAQLRFEVNRALGAEATVADLDEVTSLALSGRCGTGAIQVAGAPDIVDVSSLEVRGDGTSIYRRPNEARYATEGHLDLEKHVLEEARRTVPQRVTAEQATAVLRDTDLSGEQRDAVARLLTTTTATTILTAAAGAGKTHTVAAFAKAWTTLTGRRVIGLAVAENAARVLTNEGLAESYNIASFLGKTKGSDLLRYPVPLHEGDVLVLDEASQLSTADWALIQQAAKSAGALIVPTGDTEQLGPVEAGGMFRMLAETLGAIELTKVRRFASAWERDASLRLRQGDKPVLAAYDTRGRMRGLHREAAYARAAGAWLADHLRGKDVLLLAGSNAEAAELARLVQAQLIKAGSVHAPCTDLADGNRAGVGDLVRARLNVHIDAGGQQLTNRDTLKITAADGADVQVRRLLADGSWSARFTVPADYLREGAELAYAGNVHVAQGRTVDLAHLLVTETLSLEALYVALTRGREANHAWVVTGETAPEGREPYPQAAPEAVLGAIMERSSRELTATEQITAAQEWAGGTGHVLTIWSAAVKDTTRADIDDAVKAVLHENEFIRYMKEHQRPILHQALQERQLSGEDINALIARITNGPMTGARSVSAVLHGRLSRIQAPETGTASWAERTPASAPEVAHAAAEALDSRTAELGQRMLDKPEPWLTTHLGTPPDPDSSPLLREDYARRAGIAAAYREAQGITDPCQAISLEPHHGNPQLYAMRKATIRALEIPDEEALIRAASRGELEGRQLEGERAQATAPHDVSHQLKATAQAEADWRDQAAQAQIRKDEAEAKAAADLARTLEAERVRLEAVNSEHEAWSARTAATRETAGKALAELERRGQAPLPEQPAEHQSMLQWWREFEAGAEGVDRALRAEQQRAENEGRPWPPEREHQAEEEPSAELLEAETADLEPSLAPDNDYYAYAAEPDMSPEAG